MMRVYKLTYDGSRLLSQNISDVLQELFALEEDGILEGTEVSIETLEMTEEEFDAEPEFEGW